MSAGISPNIHDHNLHFRDKSRAYWQKNRRCSYVLGEHFLLTLYVELGREVAATSLRELHQGAVAANREPGEEAIYQTLLSNTPPGLHERFEALYDLFHGRPKQVSTEVGGETIVLPENLIENPQSLALVTLYVATDGPNWLNSENWLSELPLSQWEGVSADADDNVTSLYLIENGLSGPLPPELGNLTYLEQLNLHGNNLTGAIPPELGNLTGFSLLILSNNQLSGPLPPELANLTGLRMMRLDSNELTGPIPPGLGNLAELQIMNLSRNGLSGTLPAQLAGMGALSHLDLRENQLSGPFPPELSRLNRLESLQVWRSGLTGCIPDALANVPTNDFFQDGSLSPCGGEGALFQLAGDVETDRAALEAFYHATGGDTWTAALDAYFGGGVTTNWLSDRPLGEWHGVDTDRNGRVVSLHLTEVDLSGSLPPELGNLSGLRQLSLYRNQLTGPIPPSLGNLTHLTWLGLSGNQLTGPIPPSLGNLTNLEALQLDRNQLEGPIPRLQSNLTHLALAQNRLTGPIPPEVGNMTNLEGLHLNDNQLSGPIPPQLANLPNLERLYLANDQLTGCPPAGLLERQWHSTDINGDWLSGRGCSAAGSTAADGAVQSAAADDATEDAAGDRQALEAFYHAAGGPNWENNANWLSDEPLHRWHGVSANTDGRVTELELARNGLSGSISPELGSLAYLRKLDLRINQLTGSIPAGLGNLQDLKELPPGREPVNRDHPARIGQPGPAHVAVPAGKPVDRTGTARVGQPVQHEQSRPEPEPA